MRVLVLSTLLGVFITGLLSAQIKINKTDVSGKTWVVLGFVEDSEQGAIIDKVGNELRMKYEALIQSMGGNIYTMASSERMKLQRMWSIPFTGRLPEQLKEFAVKNKISILTGSYLKSNKNNISILGYEYSNNKVKVYHDSKIINEPNESKARTVKPQEKRKNGVTDGFKINLKTYESVRRRPGHLKGRRDKRKDKNRELKQIREYFAKSPVLQSLKNKFKNKSDNDKIKEAESYAQRAADSWLTTTKIELMSRAWVLLDMVPSATEKEKNQILSSILEHEEFSIDWGGED
jgi:hypothetical protein